MLQHLGELRRRVLICIAALAVATLIAWFFYDDLLSFMIAPYRDYLVHHPGKNIAHASLVTTGPLEGFTTRLQVSAYAGATLVAVGTESFRDPSAGARVAAQLEALENACKTGQDRQLA